MGICAGGLLHRCLLGSWVRQVIAGFWTCRSPLAWQQPVLSTSSTGTRPRQHGAPRKEGEQEPVTKKAKL